MTRIGHIFRGWLTPLARRYSLDVRSLALLRMGLAIAVLMDLWWRSPDIIAHYSDAGIMPRVTVIAEHLGPLQWSLHLLSGSPGVQGLLFVTAALIALALLVGYRTRLATITTWALVVSLHHRNPALLFAADSVLRAVLFWSMFLPLGAAYSVDSALNPKQSSVPKQIFSGAVLALTVQQCFIYIFSAVFKTSSELWWPDLTAVYYSLSFDQYVTPLGAALLNLPLSLLQGMTAITLILEWVGPLFLFMPFRTAFFRTVTVITFIGLHVGFGLTLNLGIFPFLSVISWLAFIPTAVWTSWKKRFYGEPQEGLRIYYDADCGFCKKVVHLMRTFLLLPDTPLVAAQHDDSIQADMEKWNSWVVVDWQGNRYFKFEAITYVFSLSPVFRYVVPILTFPPIFQAGTRFYEAIANNRMIAGNFTRPLKFDPFTAITPLWQSGVTLSLLGLTFLLNLRGITDHWAFVDQSTPALNGLRRITRSRALQRVEGIGYFLRLDQGGWAIFAPAPPRDDGWHVVVGTLADGSQVNLLEPGHPISFDKPTLRDRQRIYRNMQWRTYFINLNRNIGNRLYPDYGRYLCTTWMGSTNNPLTNIEVYFIEERTVPPGEIQPIEQHSQFQTSCQ